MVEIVGTFSGHMHQSLQTPRRKSSAVPSNKGIVMVLVLLRDDAPTPASRALVMLQDTEYRGTGGDRHTRAPS